MEIFGFLFGLGCLVVIAWAIASLGNLVFDRKHWQRRRSSGRSPDSSAVREPRRSAPSPPLLPVLPRPAIVRSCYQFQLRFGLRVVSSALHWVCCSSAEATALSTLESLKFS